MTGTGVLGCDTANGDAGKDLGFSVTGRWVWCKLFWPFSFTFGFSDPDQEERNTCVKD